MSIQNWQQKQIKDLLEYEQPGKYIVENGQYVSVGTPVLTANKSFILGYTKETQNIYDNIPVIIFDDFTTDSKFVDFPFKIKSSAIKILQPKNKNVDLRFVYEKMKSIDFPTGNHKRYYISQYQEMEVLVPPFPIQQKISTIAAFLEEESQKSNQIIQKLEILKNGLMNELLTKGIDHKKFKKTKLGEIPEEWEVSTIGENAIHVGSGATPRGGSKVYLKSGIPLIRSQNVHFERLDLSDVVYISPEIHEGMSRSKLLKNDVLLNITGASLGRVNIVPEYFEQGNVNQHVCIIRTKKVIYPLYLKYYLESKLGQKQIFKYQIGGNREGLNFQQVRAITIALPQVKEQKTIVEVIESVNTKIIQERLRKNKHILLKRALMQDIFNQKIEIN